MNPIGAVLPYTPCGCGCLWVPLATCGCLSALSFSSLSFLFIFSPSRNIFAPKAPYLSSEAVDLTEICTQSPPHAPPFIINSNLFFSYLCTEIQFHDFFLINIEMSWVIHLPFPEEKIFHMSFPEGNLSENSPEINLRRFLYSIKNQILTHLLFPPFSKCGNRRKELNF